MIKINLLPIRAEKRGFDLKAQAAIAVVSLLVVAGVCFWFYNGIQNQINRTQQEIARIEKETKELQAIIGEIDKIKDRKIDLQKKLDVIDKLEAGRLETVRTMEDIAKATPEQLWFRTFKFSGGRVAISGYALDNQIIAKFIQNLNENSRVQNVVLTETTRAKSDGIELVSFGMTFNMQPIAADKKQG